MAALGPSSANLRLSGGARGAVLRGPHRGRGRGRPAARAVRGGHPARGGVGQRLLRAGRAGARLGVPRRPAAAPRRRPRRAGAGRRCARGGAPAGGARPARPLDVPQRAGHRGWPESWWSSSPRPRPSRCRWRRTSARWTSGSRPSRSGRGLPIRARDLAIGAIVAGAGAAALSALDPPLAAPLVDAGHRRGRRLRRRDEPARADRHRPALQRLRRASAVERAAGERASSWESAAASRSASVYRVDASRRSTALNAYVAGIGPTKRVVLYDTLIDGDDGARARVGRRARARPRRPLGHPARDPVRGARHAARAAARPRALGCARAALRRRAGLSGGRAGAVPGDRAWSRSWRTFRRISSRARSKRARTRSRCGSPTTRRASIDLQVRLAERNLSDVDPPGWAIALFGTHPTTLERIGSARAWEEVSARSSRLAACRGPR